jgi:hypothetical protein
MHSDMGSNRLLLIALLFAFSALETFAQDLTPRAYVITPVGSNALIVNYSYFDGEIVSDESSPISDAKGKINVPLLTYYHSLNFFGRSANFAATLPYGIGNFAANVNTSQVAVYRSGLQDSVYRFSVNLMGGPAMRLEDFVKWRQKTIVGASLRVVAPTGQYDPAKLVNYGANRWAFKPEIGVSRRWGNWLLDGYGALAFFTRNSNYLSHSVFGPGVNTLTQEPIGATEGHLSYNVKPRLWCSLDGNFWHGGRTSVNGIQRPGTLQKNSRVGFTVSAPVTKHQSLKFAYANGAYIRFGGNYQSISIAWQYSWIGLSK